MKEIKNKVNTNKITEGSIFGQLLLFFFPILFGTFFQQLYNTADAVVVGRFVGKQALAAVGGTTSTLINLLVGFFVGLSSGATVVISQFYGARKPDKVHWAVHTAVAFSLIGGVLFMIIGVVFAHMALSAMHTPEDVLTYAVVYIRIYFLGMIPNLIYNMGAGILRAVGDSKRPLYFLIGSCMVNILLDLILVAGLRLGVAGAAIATISSQFFSACMVVYALTHTEDMYKLVWSKVHIDGRMLQRIVRIGIPAGMQSVMYNISNIIIQSGVNTLGTDNVTAWATYGKVDGLYWMMINALGISVTTFVGQNYGARRMDRVRKGAGACMVIGVVLTAIVSTALYFWGYLFIELFTSDPQVQLISQSLRGAVQNTPEGREGMALGQYIAGMGFSNVGLGIVHSMAHGLSALYDTPHGVACAILLPVGLEYNKSVAGERYRAVGKAMGVVGIDEMNDVEAADATIAAVKQLSADVGIPVNLHGILKEEDIQFLAESAFADACRPGNPRDTSVEEIVELYKSQL
mgnify:CR=1 FL=1